jgi:hypothetical protein
MQMQEAKDALKRYKEGTLEYEKIEKNYKHWNKKHTDRVHLIAELKEKMDSLYEKIEEFKDKYFEEFRTIFLSKTDKIKHEILESLDFAAYRFDKEIYKSAKQSKKIKEFFEDAQIKGLLSSKTFVEYYTKNLNKDIASTQNRKIINYLKNYNNTNKIQIALIGNNIEELNKNKKIIQTIDSSIFVSGYIDYQLALEQFKHKEFEVIIIDEYVNKTPASKIIKEFLENYQDKADNIKFCVNLLNNKNSQEYHQAKELGVFCFLDSFMNNSKIIHTVKEVI